MKQKTQLKGIILLALTAFIWGSSFVAQDIGMENVDSFTFGGIRTLLGAIVLLPVILIRDKISAKSMNVQQLCERKESDKKALKYGIILGLVFCIATNLQQFAFEFPEASPGKIAFVTAMYMFFVPLLGLVFLKKRLSFITWICVAMGFVGLYFLCMTPGDMGAISKSDIFSFACSLFFAIHILLIEKFAPGVDGVKMSCMQFFVSGTITSILMLIFDKPQFSQIQTAIIPILYSGIMSCGVAYTFQIIGQKYTEATVASLIMCTESVFAVLCSALVLSEIPTVREAVGCVIMFAAIVLSELSGVITEKIKKNEVA